MSPLVGEDPDAHAAGARTVEYALVHRALRADLACLLTLLNAHDLSKAGDDAEILLSESIERIGERVWLTCWESEHRFPSEVTHLGGQLAALVRARALVQREALTADTTEQHSFLDDQSEWLASLLSNLALQLAAVLREAA